MNARGIMRHSAACQPAYLPAFRPACLLPACLPLAHSVLLGSLLTNLVWLIHLFESLRVVQL